MEEKVKGTLRHANQSNGTNVQGSVLCPQRGTCRKCTWARFTSFLLTSATRPRHSRAKSAPLLTGKGGMFASLPPNRSVFKTVPILDRRPYDAIIPPKLLREGLRSPRGILAALLPTLVLAVVAVVVLTTSAASGSLVLELKNGPRDDADMFLLPVYQVWFSFRKDSSLLFQRSTSTHDCRLSFDRYAAQNRTSSRRAQVRLTPSRPSVLPRTHQMSLMKEVLYGVCVPTWIMSVVPQRSA